MPRSHPRWPRRGFFWEAWAKGGEDWARIEVPAARIARITPAFLAQERRALGESWYRQEYECSFEALEGLVYPDFGRCVVPGPAPAGGPKVGGIDFGFRNPFAAVWGVLDRNDVSRSATPRPSGRRQPAAAAWTRRRGEAVPAG